MGDITSLADLKEHLRQSLAAVEQQEHDENEQMRPQTVAEIDDLTQKLQGALDELQTRRGELQQHESKSSQAEGQGGKGGQKGGTGGQAEGKNRQ